MLETEKPFFGYSGNWSVVSSAIKCWADAIGAMVYKLGGDAVLAHDEQEAIELLAGARNREKIEDLDEEIRGIQSKIWDLEDEMYELEEEKKKLKKAQELATKKEQPVWLKQQLTLGI